jgi:hypothetical protein
MTVQRIVKLGNFGELGATVLPMITGVRAARGW